MLYTDYEVITFPAEGTTDLPGLILCYLRSKSHGEMQNVYELGSESSVRKVQLLQDRSFLHIKACNSFWTYFISSKYSIWYKQLTEEKHPTSLREPRLYI